MFIDKDTIFERDTDLLDFASEKKRDVFGIEPTPWDKVTLRKHTTSAESHLLYKLAKEQGPGNYADLGCLYGGSAATIAHGLEEAGGGFIYCVDYFGTGPWQDPGVTGAPDLINDYFTKTFKQVKHQICAGPTADWSSRLQVPLQGIFIDAGHDYENCKRDWELWNSKVVPGGWVAFHDTNFTGVNKVLNEIDLSKWQFIRQVFSIKVYRKI